MSDLEKTISPDVQMPEGEQAPPHAVADEPMPEGEEAPPRGVRAMAMVRWALVLMMALAAFAGLNHRYGWVGKGRGGAGSGVVYYCSMHPAVKQDHPGDCPICSMTLVRQPMPGEAESGEPASAETAGGDGHDHAATASGEYYCPMHPEVTSTDPSATCEKCGGMKLVPKPAGLVTPPKDAEGVPGLVPVTLSPERTQLMGMRTAKVKRETLVPELRTVGTVVANEKGLAVIQVRFAGWIEDLKVEQTGEKVKKGQVLATIYSPDLLTAQQEYLNALAWAKKSDGGRVPDLSAGLGKDARRRLELLGISNKEIDQIERSGEPMRAIPVRSPVSGYVIEKNAVQGLYVQPGTALFQVADLSTVWVVAEVHEHEIGRVAVGQAASIELAAYPGERFTGKLAFVYPSLNPDTRTLRVRFDLENPGLRLKPGMYGNVYLELERAEALLVPVEAIVDTGVVQYVFVALPKGRFDPRKVKLGARYSGKVEVLLGLAEGETVVTTANFLLDSESHLQASLLGEGTSGGGTVAPGDFCATEFDQQKFPEKHQQCVACRAHRGMGAMEDDCRNQIPKPWK